VRVSSASHILRRLSARGWRARLGRVALATAAIFFLLALFAGASHQHGSFSSLHRIDCKACAWVHSAAGALGHAAPALTVFSVDLALHAPGSVPQTACAASPHHGRAPPAILL